MRSAVLESQDVPAIAVPTRGATSVRVAHLGISGIVTVRFGADDTVSSVDGDPVVMPGKTVDFAIPHEARWLSVNNHGKRVNLGWRGGRGPANEELEDGMSVATVTISAAQLKDLVANPVELVPAPGVGKCIWPISAFIQYSFGTTPYGPTSLAQIHVLVGDFAIYNLEGLNNVLNKTDDGIFTLAFEADADVSVFANLPLLFKNISGDNLTDGNGTLTVTVLYKTINLS